jgi:copper chaperone
VPAHLLWRFRIPGVVLEIGLGLIGPEIAWQVLPFYPGGVWYRQIPDQPEESTMVNETFTVVGMTCGHCVNAVSGEVAKIVGVADVDVDLETGRVTITSDAAIDPAALAAAIDEAGYELAP